MAGMFSGDRRKVEIARAEAGLPMVDDLEGMFSGDQRLVLEAHARARTSVKKDEPPKTFIQELAELIEKHFGTKA